MLQKAFNFYVSDLIDDDRSAFIRVDGVSKQDLKAACMKAFALNKHEFLYVTTERHVSSPLRHVVKSPTDFLAVLFVVCVFWAGD